MIHDDELSARLAASEGRVPVDAAAPALAGGRAARRRALSFVSAPVLALAISATALAGVGVVRLVTTASSPFPPGPLAGSQLACMTPTQAADWLAAHGYHDVSWGTEAAGGSIDEGANGAVTIDSQPGPETRTVPSTGRVLSAWYDNGTVHVTVNPVPDSQAPAACQ